MIHPLLRLVATQPHLLADHAEAYAGLVSEEVGKTAGSLTKRVVLGVVALALIGVATVLTGVAVMLWAAVPASSLHEPWVLIVVPALPWAGAVACGLMAMQKQEDPFAELKKQLAADLNLIREVSAA